MPPKDETVYTGLKVGGSQQRISPPVNKEKCSAAKRRLIAQEENDHFGHLFCTEIINRPDEGIILHMGSETCNRDKPVQAVRREFNNVCHSFPAPLFCGKVGYNVGFLDIHIDNPVSTASQPFSHCRSDTGCTACD